MCNYVPLLLDDMARLVGGCARMSLGSLKLVPNKFINLT